MLPIGDRGAGVGDAAAALGLTRADVAWLEFDALPNQPVNIAVPVNGQPVTLVLAPVSDRAPGFRVRVQEMDGSWHDAEPGPVRTYEGVSPDLPGSRVSAYVEDGKISARIAVPGLPGAFWVEPAPTRMVPGAVPGPVPGPARANNVGGVAHVGYHSLDRMTPGRDAGAAPLACDAVPSPASRGASTPRAEADAGRAVCAAPPAVCVAELACDSDFEFFQAYGSAAAVQAQIERVIAVMNAQFIAEVGIRHRITTILVRTAPGPPYTSFQATPLLLQMQASWNTEQQSVPRDVAKLFTGKALSSGVQGSAFTGSICSLSNAYALVRSDCCAGLVGATDVSAHELGHIWGAAHCNCSFPNPNSTMNASITFANSFVTDISGASVASITAGRDSASCLEPDAPVPPAGSFALSSPPPETWGLTGPVSLQWGASANAAFYVVTVADNPGFVSPVASVATLAPAASIPANLLATATRYFWRVDAWNEASASTPSSSGSWTFLTAAPPPSCPGDFFQDNAVNTIDLTFLLGRFGQLVPPGQQGDMNGDGRVNTIDLTAFLGRFGTTCP